jgi:hypothetical protein
MVPGIESRWGEIFRTCPDRPWGPPSLLYNGYWVFPGRRMRPGRDADHSPLLAPRSKNRVKLYLYSPYGPSWPVKRVKSTYFLNFIYHFSSLHVAPSLTLYFVLTFFVSLLLSFLLLLFIGLLLFLFRAIFNAMPSSSLRKPSCATQIYLSNSLLLSTFSL